MSCFGGPEIKNEDLIGYWDANNPRSYSRSGTSWVNINDSTSATIYGAPTFNSNGYFTFNGSNNYVMIPSISQPIRTIIAWVTMSTVGDYTIFGPDSNSSDNWFGIYTSSNLYALFSEDSDINNTYIFGNASTISANTWYQVACTIDTNTVKLYINGKLDTSKTVAFTIGPWNAVCAIGRRGSIAQRYYNGNIASVATFNKVFTENEIRQNFNALRGRFGI